ncbi:metal-sulfur cluster assembly factor [Lichenifustis flavocetrariae]|uniref:Iron-sulfur cluster assembly protein n=1 Tax=Lichenifustis flavocetrariae TaxID=2949735 RepID=A0AA41YX91_9HYPH|nr:iron-sulfur cluster assembly protein [Lichenifustis flavocetrariae]MCW6508857.1 iron-sulfur cluster assembly protein [Lichenifustis flavocetrariae]
MPGHQRTAREAEVWAQLDGVSDPELDEPVTDLQFVTSVTVDAENRVAVAFRLPTYWCAANFSFLMADDMRAAVVALPWVRSVEVRLGEHMYADTINAGLAKGLSFEDTFGAEADGNLDDIRRTFLRKAFQRRQAALIDHLVKAGFALSWIAVVTIAGLKAITFEPEASKLVRRYFERRAVVGPMRDEAFAFIDVDGARLQPETLLVYLRNLRRVGINAEFNSALCKGLLAARFDTDTPFVPPRQRTPATVSSATGCH